MAESKTTKTAEVPVKNYVTSDSAVKYSVKLPVIEGEGDKIVIVNERRYTVARGKTVQVPEWVYEQLQHEEEMVEAELAYRKKIDDKFKTF